MPGLNRREFFTVAGAGLTTACSEGPQAKVGPKSAVAIVKAASYTVDLVDAMRRGVAECGLDVKGLKVLLKPNMVEFDKSTSINTDVAIIAAAYDLFKSMGAAEVTIAEGPGHRRDTLGLAGEAGYRSGLTKFDAKFVDLNRDDVSAVDHFASEPRIFLPNTALAADLIVSLPKMKTHHWAGATLSMKNFFGTVPGAVYGWPKNFLHIVGIDKSIVELNRIFRKTFAIVDGIVGMEGNGPIQGTPVHAGVLVMGKDLIAVDATCCRMMGIDPAKVQYLQMATELGQSVESQIEQRGEAWRSVRKDFRLIKEFESYRLG